MRELGSSQPTAVELEILRILWDLGPSTVRDMHLRLCEGKETNYSTTVKMLAVMLGNGLVKRDDSVRPLVYRAAMTRERAAKSFLSDRQTPTSLLVGESVWQLESLWVYSAC